MPTRVAFASLNWGLGHVTRDLVLIRALIEANCAVTVIATGQALAVFREELADACDYLDWPDIPIAIDRHPIVFHARMAAMFPLYLKRWRDDRVRINRMVRDNAFDIIISDQRYGIASPHVKTIWFTNILHLVMPGRPRPVERLFEAALARASRHVDRFVIPDYPDGRLTGDMCHNLRYFAPERLCYIGVIAGARKQPVEADVDVFVSISGPDPQRAELAKLVLEQVGGVDGRVVVSLGRRGADIPATPSHVKVHDYLARDEQERMLNRSRLVVSRAGYSTLSEIIELGKPALFIPTPGQTEQECNGARLIEAGWYHVAKQRGLDLPKEIEAARSKPIFTPPWNSDHALERFVEAVLD